MQSPPAGRALHVADLAGDHTWVVASEEDWDSTIVAGSRALVDSILADDHFEAFEVHEDDDLSWDGDLLNPRQQPTSEP